MAVLLLFSANHLPFSLLIQAATFSKWSHVDIVTDEGKLIGATIPKGVIEYDAATRIKHSTRYEFRTIDADVQTVYRFVRSQIGRPYDWKGIFGLELNRNWQSDDAWFCSELAGKAAILGGNTAIKEDVFRLTPGDLYKYTSPLVLKHE